MALFGELDELVKHARVQTKLLQLTLETISSQVDPEQKRNPYDFSKLSHDYSDDDDILGDMLDHERSYLARNKFLNSSSDSLMPTDESIDRQEDRVQELYEGYKEHKHDNEDNDE